MNRIEWVVFDMDGLMVDSEPVQLKAVNDALRPLGISVTENEFIAVVGRKAIENFRYLKERYGLDESPETLEERKNKAYFKRVARELKPMPGLFKTLEMCRRNGLEVALASSSPGKDIRMTLAILGLTDRFPIIASGDLVKKGKPHPGIFLKVAEMAGKCPSAFVVLEDTEHGIKAAKAAGMHAVAVPNGFTRHHDFTRADLVLNSLGEFTMEIVNRLAQSSSAAGPQPQLKAGHRVVN